MITEIDEVGQARRRREATQVAMLNDGKTTLTLSEITRKRLNDMHLAVQAGNAVAQAAVNVANSMVKQYELSINAFLEEQGIDPDTVSIGINLKTGELTATLKKDAETPANG